MEKRNFETSIHKNPKTPPNMENYEQVRNLFSWSESIATYPSSTLGKNINIAQMAVDNHCRSSLKDHIALKFIEKNFKKKDLSFQNLMDSSNQFANVLVGLGVKKAAPIGVLLNRIPELYITALGTWKNLNIFAPLFSAFGSEPIFSRLLMCQATVLVTTEDIYKKKLQTIHSAVPDLKHIIIIYSSPESPRIPGTLDFYKLMGQASIFFSVPETDPEDLAILHFTSGTTGKPKGALHVHAALKAHYITGQFSLDLHPKDIFWCTADPGWVTGTSYGIISPLLNGVTSIVYEGDFDPDRWYQILEKEKVTVWYTAPTAIRMMMKRGTQPLESFDLSSLRFISSVGEPLNAEAVSWGLEAFDIPIHDNWWQTETGGIMISNYECMDIKPGSMGRPLPGIEATVVRRLPNNRLEFLNTPNQEGELALKSGWPSMFRGYLNDTQRYQNCFCEGYYLTGDLVKKDQDGYYWFIGRADDVIKSSGHLIGPFEVEKALMEHPAVVEAAVVGIPDPVIFESVKAFVSLKNNFQPSEELKLEILGHARKKLGPALAPRDIQILSSLPKTRSGKIMRRLLKARELGLPEGDTSMMETNL